MSLKPLVALLLLALLAAAPARADNDEARARELINSQGCKGCHTIEGSGGTLGPDLDGVGGRLSRQELRRALVAPAERNPDGLMPTFSHLDDQDLDALVDFLAKQKP